VSLVLTSGNSISGTVLDDTQQPIEGVSVQAKDHVGDNDFRRMMEDGFKEYTTPESALKKAVTNFEGAFIISGLEGETTYDIESKAEGFVSAQKSNIEINSSNTVIVMERRGTVEGKILRQSTTDPVKNFTVRIIPAPEDNSQRGQRGFMDRFRGDRGRRDRGRGQRGAANEDDGMRALFDVVRGTMGRNFFNNNRLTDKKEEFSTSDGRYILNDIIPGRYRLIGSAKGYAPKIIESFTIEKGQLIRDKIIDLGPGATISGKVVTGSKTVSKAEITISSEDRRDNDLNLKIDCLKECFSDSNGSFKINSLPPGGFFVSAYHPDYPSAKSELIKLVEGQAHTNLIITLPASASIVGTVFDQQGIPLSRETVSCKEEEERWAANRTRTNKEGSFEFDDLKPGTYTVTLSGGGGRRNMFQGREDRNSVSIKLGEGEIRKLVLTKTPPEGVIVSGIITDGGTPVNGGFLTISPDGRGGARSAAIDQNGYYKVEGVSIGMNRFSVRLGRDSSATLLFAIPDTQETVIDFELPGGTISGTVIDGSTGLVISGVQISIDNQADPGQQQDRGGRGRFMGNRPITSDEYGRFTFQMLNPGVYRLRAEARGRSFSSSGTGYFPAEVDGIVVSENQIVENIKIVLVKGGAIQSKVINKNNEPIPSVTLTAKMVGAESNSRSNRGRTNDKGEAVLNGLEPGEYTVTFQPRGLALKAINNIHVLADQYSTVDVVLVEGVNVTLNLFDSENNQVRNASLVIRDAMGTPLSINFGRRRGDNYNLNILEPGAYSVEASWSDRSGSASFVVENSSLITLTLK